MLEGLDNALAVMQKSPLTDSQVAIPKLLLRTSPLLPDSPLLQDAAPLGINLDAGILDATEAVISPVAANLLDIPSSLQEQELLSEDVSGAFQLFESSTLPTNTTPSPIRGKLAKSAPEGSSKHSTKDEYAKFKTWAQENIENISRVDERMTASEMLDALQGTLQDITIAVVSQSVKDLWSSRVDDSMVEQIKVAILGMKLKSNFRPETLRRLQVAMTLTCLTPKESGNSSQT